MGNISNIGRFHLGRHFLRVVGAFIISAALLVPSLSALAATGAQAGLVSTTYYSAPQFVFDLQWNAPWRTDDTMVESIPGKGDRIALFGTEGAFQSLLIFGNDLQGSLQKTINSRIDQYPDLQVVGTGQGTNTLGLSYLSATLSYDITGESGDKSAALEYIEVSPVYTADLNGGVLVAIFIAPAQSMQSEFQNFLTNVVYDEGVAGPIYAGQPAAGGASGVPAGKSTANDSEANYLGTLDSEMTTLTDSVNSFYDLLNNPNLGDQTTVNQLNGILATTWITAYSDAQSMTPPSGYEDVHAAYLKFTGLLAEAANDIYNSDITSATTALEQSQQAGQNLMDLLQQHSSGPAILGKKSG